MQNTPKLGQATVLGVTQAAIDAVLRQEELMFVTWGAGSNVAQQDIAIAVHHLLNHPATRHAIHVEAVDSNAAGNNAQATQTEHQQVDALENAVLQHLGTCPATTGAPQGGVPIFIARPQNTRTITVPAGMANLATVINNNLKAVLGGGGAMGGAGPARQNALGIGVTLQHHPGLMTATAANREGIIQAIYPGGGRQGLVAAFAALQGKDLSGWTHGNAGTANPADLAFLNAEITVGQASGGPITANEVAAIQQRAGPRQAATGHRSGDAHTPYFIILAHLVDLQLVRNRHQTAIGGAQPVAANAACTLANVSTAIDDVRTILRNAYGNAWFQDPTGLQRLQTQIGRKVILNVVDQSISNATSHAQNNDLFCRRLRLTQSKGKTILAMFEPVRHPHRAIAVVGVGANSLASVTQDVITFIDHCIGQHLVFQAIYAEAMTLLLTKLLNGKDFGWQFGQTAPYPNIVVGGAGAAITIR